VGQFLLLSGADESLKSLKRVATLIVNDVGAASRAVEAHGGSVIEGPCEATNGPRMIARHHDGAVFEYVQVRQH
jgi:predicted enzyme related to lactoylglutathione lyase